MFLRSLLPFFSMVKLKLACFYIQLVTIQHVTKHLRINCGKILAVFQLILSSWGHVDHLRGH